MLTFPWSISLTNPLKFVYFDYIFGIGGEFLQVVNFFEKVICTIHQIYYVQWLENGSTTKKLLTHIINGMPKVSWQIKPNFILNIYIIIVCIFPYACNVIIHCYGTP
jgi:hypothetical protein